VRGSAVKQKKGGPKVWQRKASVQGRGEKRQNSRRRGGEARVPKTGRQPGKKGPFASDKEKKDDHKKQVFVESEAGGKMMFEKRGRLLAKGRELITVPGTVTRAEKKGRIGKMIIPHLAERRGNQGETRPQGTNIQRCEKSDDQVFVPGKEKRKEGKTKTFRSTQGKRSCIIPLRKDQVLRGGGKKKEVIPRLKGEEKHSLTNQKRGGKNISPGKKKTCGLKEKRNELVGKKGRQPSSLGRKEESLGWRRFLPAQKPGSEKKSACVQRIDVGSQGGGLK